MDDTFCALAALTLHRPELIDSQAMANIVSLLTLVEDSEGGPYRTWLVPPQAAAHWQDIDLAVNSNVAYFLSLHDIALPNITELIESAITSKTYESKYYHSPYPIIYFISRAYSGSKKKAVSSFLLAQQNRQHNWSNTLNSALAVTSLLNIGVDPDTIKPNIEALRSQQSATGSWPAYAFCLDPAIQGQIYYAGSTALTTAFCLEAISKYEQLRTQQKSPPATRQSQTRQEQYITGKIRKRIHQRLSTLDGELKKNATDIVDQTLAKDSSKQITLLAYSMRQALGKRGQDIAQEIIITLGQANVYGWLAYTIYDDFLDREGTPLLLPAANLFFREAIYLFDRVLLPDTSFQYVSSEVLTAIDAANAWEVTHCQYSHAQLQHFHDQLIPDYGDLTQLANKSLGHVLGPVALLLSIGYSPDANEVKQLIISLKHFIIARQLNDDAHDWRDDLTRGQINAAAAIVIKQFLRARALVTLNLTDEVTITKLEEFFWQTTIETISTLVLQHINQARQTLTENPAIKQPKYITQFFDPIEKIARQTLEEREQTLQFIDAYSRATIDR